MCPVRACLRRMRACVRACVCVVGGGIVCLFACFREPLFEVVNCLPLFSSDRSKHFSRHA